MTPGDQRGQALPTVLVIMLLLVLLAGGASMAVSAVLTQQTTNRASINADLSSQNAVAAMAANISGGSECATPPDSLFSDDFGTPLGSRWRLAPAGAWRVQPDENNNPVLAATQPGPNLATPNLQGAAQWLYYSVSVDVRPQSTADGSFAELDAFYQQGGQNASAYYLRLEAGGGPGGRDSWSFGRTGAGGPFGQGGFTYDTTRWETLELDVFGGEITAWINGRFMGRRQDSSIDHGSIAIRTNNQVEVDNLSVDQPVPQPGPVSLTLPVTLPSPGIPAEFHCQRLGGVDTGAVSQRRVGQPSASTCSPLGTVTMPAGADHLKVWFTVPWPAGAAPGRVTVGVGACPGSQSAVDCGRQRDTIVQSGGTPWRPGLTVLGADCANTNPNQAASRSYTVYLTTRSSYRGGLQPLVVRSAVAGDGSVYMTAMAVRTASGEPYVESDILMPSGGPAVLSYEGVLG